MKATLNSYASHFELGYRSKSMTSTNSEFYKQVELTPTSQIKYDSTIIFGSDKPENSSISKAHYSFKEIPSDKNIKCHKNTHNYVFGYDRNTTTVNLKDQQPQKKQEIDYINQNKQTSIIMGNDRSNMNSISKTSYIEKKRTDSKNSSGMEFKNSKSFFCFGSEKNDFTTSSMQLKGEQAGKTPTLKVPDSDIFSKKQYQDVFRKSYSQSVIKPNISKPIQDPSITNQFIYSQHYKLGSFNAPQEQPLKPKLQICRDSDSLLVNKTKILGSSIDLGLCKNQYKTDYHKYYVKKEINPPTPIRNCQSTVFFGIGEPEKLSGYNLEYNKRSNTLV